jgi:hypothetical protein
MAYLEQLVERLDDERLLIRQKSAAVIEFDPHHLNDALGVHV